MKGILRNVARREPLVLMFVGLLPIVARMAQLPWNPLPAPVIADEFTYLLAGDTFAHGRVTNSPNPLWIHFETFHVIQQPTYAAKYPFAQGLILAVGEVFFRNPWIGVVFSVGLMCAALCWMLQGWVSRCWALIGGTLAVTMFFHHYWMDSYWGGAAAAIGGAFVVGALPRLHRGDLKAAWWMSCGVVLLASSRPYEGFLVAAPATAAVLFWSWRGHRLESILGPLCSFLIPFIVFSLYYNWRITGNMMRLPYVLYDATYSPVPVFHGQHLPSTPHFNNPEMARGHQQELERFKAQQGVGHAFTRLLQILEVEPDDLGGYPRLLWVPLNLLMLCALPWLVAVRKLRIPLLCFALAVFGMIPTRVYFEHYSAPILGLRLLFWIESLRRVSYLKLWRNGWLPRLVPTAVLLGCFSLLFSYLLYSPFRTPQMHGIEIDRPRLSAELGQRPGKHLVVVQYSANHDPNREWVYNAADIDNSPIVWARMIDGVDNASLLRYFSDRHVWLVKPDEEVIRLTLLRSARSPDK